ncbi:MAG: glycosyltransferase family 2 protein [Anaerolineaceae bacterium]|nr:glycosyltransferase family 2 protein [Anaerolineaceae bacterium]
MPRIGMNPARGKTTDYKPARVTVAVLTFLPNTEGYFQNRFDVTRLCIESILANTPEPYDLLVYDNGSAPQLVDYLCELREAGRIDYLILSGQNIGKIGALRIIFNAAPGEVVAYTDDDVFFMPGWLDEHLKVLDTYPKTGMVTGIYLRDHMAENIGSTLKFAEDPQVNAQKGDLFPLKWQEHYANNTGRTWERYLEETRGLEDVLLNYKGVPALVSAGHHQFVAPKKAILEALPSEWSGALMGKMRDLDAAVDRLGYLRLCVPEPPTRLLGNLISPEMAEEAHLNGVETRGVEVKQNRPGLLTSIFRSKPVRWLAYAVYNRLYKIINA